MPVTIERFLDPWEAHVVKARLVAEGIDATVANDQLSMTNWPLSYAVGGAELQVPDEDFARARAVVEAYHRGDFERELVDAGYVAPPDPDACTCGAHAFAIPWRERVLLVLTFLLAGVTFPTHAGGRCTTCGRLRA